MFGYGICPLATEPLASWLTDFRDWTGYRRAAFVVFRKNFSPASREHILERIRLRRLYSLISEILGFRNPIVLIKFSRAWQLKNNQEKTPNVIFIMFFRLRRNLSHSSFWVQLTIPRDRLTELF